MNPFSRLWRIIKGIFNDGLNKLEDPEQQLDQAVVEMTEKQSEFKIAVRKALATQKRLEQQLKDNIEKEKLWADRAKLAATKLYQAEKAGKPTAEYKSLATRSLAQKKTATSNRVSMETQLENYRANVDMLKKQLADLESKINSAKQDKTMLKARNQAAEAQLEVQALVGGIDTTSATAAYDRMKEKVLNREAEAQAGLELSGTNIENEFAELESSDVDDDLSAMMAEIAAAEEGTAALPEATAESVELDTELESLKAEFDQ